MTRVTGLIVALLVATASVGAGAQAPKPAAKPAVKPAAKPATASPGPMLIVDTAKGVIEIQLYPADAPRTVEHIVALAKRNFYNGLRVHRVVPGFVVQFGDPQSRDMTKRDRWGSGGSGRNIGVAEVKRKHVVGAVAAAHPGDPEWADSQMYIAFAPQPKLDRDFTVFGQVTSGMDVARKLQVNDIIRRVTVKP
jgi:cyclophilin family peptidyl-prolyl cis-trans isomerase